MRIWHWADLHIKRRADDENNVIGARLVELATLERPDAIIISGDLADTPSLQVYYALLGLLERLHDHGIPVMAMPGNHDLFFAGIDYGQRPDYGKWRGLDGVIRRPTERGKHGLLVWEFEGHRFIGVDTCRGNADRRPDLARGCLGEHQRMELMLHLRPGDVVFGHHRAFWHDQAHLLEDREQLIELLTRAQAGAYLCGHEHKRHLRRHEGVTYLAARRTTQLERGLVVFDEIEPRSLAIKTLELKAA